MAKPNRITVKTKAAIIAMWFFLIAPKLSSPKEAKRHIGSMTICQVPKPKVAKIPNRRTEMMMSVAMKHPLPVVPKIPLKPESRFGMAGFCFSMMMRLNYKKK